MSVGKPPEGSWSTAVPLTPRHQLIEYVFDRSTPPPPKERRDEDDPPYAGVMVHCCRDYLPRGGRLLKKLTETSWLVQVDESELVVHEPDEAWG